MSVRVSRRISKPHVIGLRRRAARDRDHRSYSIPDYFVKKIAHGRADSDLRSVIQMREYLSHHILFLKKLDYIMSHTRIISSNTKNHKIVYKALTL